MSKSRPIEELVKESQKGNRSAFDKLASKYRSELEAFVISRLGPAVKGHFEPEDVIQETFMKAYEGLDRFQWRGAESFVRWLRAIAEHLIRNASRRHSVPLHKASLDIAASDTSPSQVMRRKERFGRLQEAMQSLSPDHRKVIELARIKGLKSQEIAERMQRSPAAVRVLLLRALEQLKSRFGDTTSVNLPDRELPIEGNEKDV